MMVFAEKKNMEKNFPLNLGYIKCYLMQGFQHSRSLMATNYEQKKPSI